MLQLQEAVLGQSHSTVLATLDILADSNARSNDCANAIRYYLRILDEIRAQHSLETSQAASALKNKRAEAAVLYKLSRVHRQQNDREAALDRLEQALQTVKLISRGPRGKRVPGSFSLESKIQREIETVREEMEEIRLEWL